MIDLFHFVNPRSKSRRAAGNDLIWQQLDLDQYPELHFQLSFHQKNIFCQALAVVFYTLHQSDSIFLVNVVPGKSPGKFVLRGLAFSIGAEVRRLAPSLAGGQRRAKKIVTIQPQAGVGRWFWGEENARAIQGIAIGVRT